MDSAPASPAGAGSGPSPSPSLRVLAAGTGWRVGEFVCRAGPGDKPFEERHEHVSISAVVEGTFRYRTSAGAALLYPGAFMLGNAGTCFECGHEHGTGDRCIGLQFEPWLFEEIAATAAGAARFRFPIPMLPAVSATAPPAVAAAAGAISVPSTAAAEAWVIGIAERVLSLVSGETPRAAAPSPRDSRRIGAVLRHIELHADEALDLDALAAIARMSKYHFLRTFRHVAGVTPHGYLIGLRLRRAALRIRTTAEPVSAIAYDAGFGDLSTFNGRFRDTFGAPPTEFRAKGRPPATTAKSPGRRSPAAAR